MGQEAGAAGHVQEAVVPTAVSYCRLQRGEQDSHAAMALRQGARTPGGTGANGYAAFGSSSVISDTSPPESTNLSTQLGAFSDQTTRYRTLL